MPVVSTEHVIAVIILYGYMLIPLGTASPVI